MEIAATQGKRYEAQSTTPTQQTPEPRSTSARMERTLAAIHCESKGRQTELESERQHERDGGEIDAMKDKLPGCVKTIATTLLYDSCDQDHVRYHNTHAFENLQRSHITREHCASALHVPTRNALCGGVRRPETQHGYTHRLFTDEPAWILSLPKARLPHERRTE